MLVHLKAKDTKKSKSPGRRSPGRRSHRNKRVHYHSKKRSIEDESARFEPSYIQTDIDGFSNFTMSKISHQKNPYNTILHLDGESSQNMKRAPNNLDLLQRPETVSDIPGNKFN